MINQSILWRRLVQSGHEFARLSSHESGWRLGGTAVFAHDEKPCCLDYHLRCNSQWQTVSGRVRGWIENEAIEVEISVDSARNWWVNGNEETGCGVSKGSGKTDLGLESNCFV